MSELPQGWSKPTLEKVGMQKTTGVQPKDSPDQTFELWSVPSFPSDQPETLKGNEIQSGKQNVEPGDVLLCKINPRINRVWVVRDKKEHEQIASTEWILLRCKQIEPAYLARALKEEKFRQVLCSNVSGVGGSLTRARPQDVKNYTINLAPLNEQKRIVAKLEKCEARIDAAKAALDDVPQLLEHYRQSVLAAAFRGDLTRDWRAAHPDAEPAERNLVNQIEAMRRRLWEEKELENFELKGKAPPIKWKERYPVAKSPPESQQQKLPKGWTWLSWNQISIWITYGFTRPMPHVDSGPTIITAKNVQLEGLDLTETHFTTDEAFNQLRPKDKPRAGDILIVKDGATTGRACLAPPDIDNCCISQAVAVVWLTHSPLNRQFLLSWVQSPMIQSQIQEAMEGMAMPHLSITDFGNMLVPIPPIEEQNEIANRLTKQLNTIKALKLKHTETTGELDSLTKSLLAKAFRGELVPQDPNDEPASKLLERIAEARKQAKPTPRKRARKQAQAI